MSAAFIVVGDGAYASVALAHACQARRATLVSRLRLDARLYGFPDPPSRGGKPGWPGTKAPASRSGCSEASACGTRPAKPSSRSGNGSIVARQSCRNINVYPA